MYAFYRRHYIIYYITGLHEITALFVALCPHLTALDALVSPIDDEARAQQIRLRVHVVGFSVQACLRKQQSSSVPPVVTIGLLSQSSVCIQGRMGASVSVEAYRSRASFYLHSRMEAWLHQRPQLRPGIAAAPGVRPEWNGEGLSLVHQGRKRFLRISWRGEQIKI